MLHILHLHSVSAICSRLHGYLPDLNPSRWRSDAPGDRVRFQRSRAGGPGSILRGTPEADSHSVCDAPAPTLHDAKGPTALAMGPIRIRCRLLLLRRILAAVGLGLGAAREQVLLGQLLALGVDDRRLLDDLLERQLLAELRGDLLQAAVAAQLVDELLELLLRDAALLRLAHDLGGHELAGDLDLLLAGDTAQDDRLAQVRLDVLAQVRVELLGGLVDRRQVLLEAAGHLRDLLLEVAA